jgi:hypothetical protein
MMQPFGMHITAASLSNSFPILSHAYFDLSSEVGPVFMAGRYQEQEFVAIVAVRRIDQYVRSEDTQEIEIAFEFPGTGQDFLADGDSPFLGIELSRFFAFRFSEHVLAVFHFTGVIISGFFYRSRFPGIIG